MKDKKRKQVYILSDIGSPYFEQAILILKPNIVREDEKLLNEARKMVDEYSAKYGQTQIKAVEKGSRLAIILSAIGILTFGGLLIMLSVWQII